ncbi:hypothetical protein [Rhodococcus sp. MTM3W5.2]|uniref:hypothetical protein n=1 Tax=Rhodococcus sp. MTM3W5.2 TaxID=1805827 RepID=UPI0021D5234C|nr:hypothetical protein [Rhodococcus sp. MTM3W5.2]
MTGVWNTKHGVQDNSFTGARYDQYPSAFTQIERADPALRTEAISTWDGIATIAGSGSPEADVVTTTPGAGSEGATDTATASAVAAAIATSRPDFVFHPAGPGGRGRALDRHPRPRVQPGSGNG